ncbi:MAG: Tol-Pal system beta propeller repeat protein TolB [Candidatus Eisenbacteria bacterium]
MEVSLPVVLAVLFAAAGAAQAQTEVWLGVTKYRTERIPIILRPFTGDERLAETLNAVVSRDLSISGFFDMIPPHGADSVRARATVDAFIDAGEGVLQGSIHQAPGGERIASSLQDLGASGPRDGAHRFSDDVIYHLTGERGISRTRIAFVRSDGRNSEICVVDWDGSNLRKVISDGTVNLTPEWSPEGGILLYTSYAEGDPDIFWREVERGTGGPVIRSPGMTSAPAWSPDGKRIALMMTRDGDSEIYVMKRDGTGLGRLTHHRGIDTSPAWAPNGRQILFVSDRSGGPQVYRMNDDGSDVRRLTFGGDYNASPKWSPRGDRIAYASREEGGFQIRVLDLVDQESYLLTAQSGNNEDPEWSPDGRHLVFTSSRTGKRRLYVMQADGSGVRLLVPGEGEDYSPSWSPRPRF